MYNVTNVFHEAAFGDSREITVRAVFNSTENTEGVKVDGNYIKDVTIEEVISANGLSIGSTCSNKATINMYMPEEIIPLSNGWFEPFVGVPTECPLGKFYITDVVTKDKYKTVTITAYDKMCHLGKSYTPSITFPAKIKTVVEDIAAQNGFSIDESALFPDYTVDALEVTEREMLGYCAGLMGKNAKFNRDGKLTFVWFNDTGMDIPLEVQYKDGFSETTADTFVLGGLISGTEDNPITAGSGRTITFSNPFMTQEILDEILNNVQGFSYTPCEVKYRCDPSFETGDIVDVVDEEEADVVAVHIVPIMAQTIKISGGLNSTIYAYGLSEESEALIKRPADKTLERVKTTLEEYLGKITDNINSAVGKNGGYYQIEYNEDGTPSGWIIMDTPVLTPTTKLWRMSAGGLGFSSNGGQTYERIAFDLEGNFYADSITSGILDCSELTVKNLNAESIIAGSITPEKLNIDDVRLTLVTADYINALEIIARSINATTGKIGGFEIEPHGLLSAYDNTFAIYDYQENPFSNKIKVQTIEGHADIGLLTDFFETKLIDSYSINAVMPIVDWPYSNFKASDGSNYYITNISKVALELVTLYSEDGKTVSSTGSITDITNAEKTGTILKNCKYVAFGFRVVATGKRVLISNESHWTQGDYSIDFFSDTYPNVDATYTLLSTTYKPKLVIRAIDGGKAEITPLLFKYGSFAVNCIGEVFVEDAELEELWSANMV